MQHSFSDFLRHGGNGHYVIARRDGHIVGRRLGLSLKASWHKAGSRSSLN
jgi:hypothetical protein